MYAATTANLNKAVKRNFKRFPVDFMFQLTEKEFKDSIFQFGTSSWGGTRKMPCAFTEQGVAMLSGVLTSDGAITVNIQIMRIYTKMREMLLTNKNLSLKINYLESKVGNHDKRIKQLFEYLNELIKQEEQPRKRIGFKTD